MLESDDAARSVVRSLSNGEQHHAFDVVKLKKTDMDMYREVNPGRWKDAITGITPFRKRGKERRICSAGGS